MVVIKYICQINLINVIYGCTIFILGIGMLFLCIVLLSVNLIKFKFISGDNIVLHFFSRELVWRLSGVAFLCAYFGRRFFCF